jgi:transcriptional regulator with XRE-family HTH domain
MPTLQFLPSIRDNETVTCPRCRTRQYPKNGNCVRCHCNLGVDYVNLQILAPFDPRSENHDKQLAHWIGDLFRTSRKRRGICQSQLSKMAAGIDRSYLSKAENGLVLLPLSKLLALAQVLGLTAVILRFEVTGTRAILLSRRRGMIQTRTQRSPSKNLKVPMTGSLALPQ